MRQNRKFKQLTNMRLLIAVLQPDGIQRAHRYRCVRDQYNIVIYCLPGIG